MATYYVDATNGWSVVGAATLQWTAFSYDANPTVTGESTGGFRMYTTSTPPLTIEVKNVSIVELP